MAVILGEVIACAGSRLEVVLVVLIVFTAAMMARGLWLLT